MDFISPNPETPTKTPFDHLMSQLLYISLSVKEREKNSAHKILFDNFEVLVIKNLEAIESSFQSTLDISVVRNKAINMNSSVAGQIAK